MPSLNPSMRMYMKEHLPLFVFVAVLFATGVAFGAVMVNALTLEQKQELSRHLGNFFQMVDQGVDIGGQSTFMDVLGMNLKWLVLIWMLGLSVIGLPLIFALDFLKGVLVGFTVGYLIGQYSWKGMLFALVSVVPQNLVIIPAIIMTSGMGMAFSIYLVKNRFLQRRGGIYQPFMSYTATVLGMVLLLTGVSLFEAYVSPAMMKSVAAAILSV